MFGVSRSCVGTETQRAFRQVVMIPGLACQTLRSCHTMKAMVLALSLAICLPANYDAALLPQQSSSPAAQPKISEISPELARLFSALNLKPTREAYEHWQYSSLEIVRAANVLRPLGREKALKVLLELGRTLHFDQTSLY